MKKWKINLKFFDNFFFHFSNFLIFHTFRGNFRLRGRVVTNETSKIVIYAIFWVYFMLRFHVPICSCTTLKNVRIYLENQVIRVQTLLIFIASPYLRTFFWAFSDSQRSGLSEIYPKNWWFWHCRNPKNVRFWTKKPHCALVKRSTWLNFLTQISIW